MMRTLRIIVLRLRVAVYIISTIESASDESFSRLAKGGSYLAVEPSPFDGIGSREKVNKTGTTHQRVIYLGHNAPESRA